MARNRNQSNKRDGRSQRSYTRDRLREEVERRGGTSGASQSATQAADAGGGSVRGGEGAGEASREAGPHRFRVQGGYLDRTRWVFFN